MARIRHGELRARNVAAPGAKTPRYRILKEDVIRIRNAYTTATPPDKPPRKSKGRRMAAGGAKQHKHFKLKDDYNHTILVGFRYAFGAPAAAAPIAPAASAVPASPVSRSYLVFFDWDKAALTDRARQIVSEAAANSTKVQFTRLEVNGYTDTSGTPQYNQGLSVRRAQAVAAELVKDGVPKSAISIQGFGDTHLLVPTGANVREPQNRRVEIIIK